MKWIKVKNKLPDKDESNLLVVIEPREYPGISNTRTVRLTNASYCSCHGFINENLGLLEGVTHWMKEKIK